MEWAGLFAIVGLWLYARKWRRTASERLFRYALASDRKEDREELAGRAVMAGSRSARLLYVLNSPELFDKARPMRPFLFGKIPCIFADYYFAQRYEDWLRTEQADFVRYICVQGRRRGLQGIFCPDVPNAFPGRRRDGRIHAMQYGATLLQTV